LLRKLVCNIQGGSDGSAQTNVSHLAEGISLSLNGTIEKHSEVLGRNATWTRKQRIARLPPLLAIQFGRFYWKATPDSQDHAGVKCKVMKPVAFNSIFDVYEFCTDSVQKELKKSRDKALKEEEDRINRKLKGEVEEKQDETTTELENVEDDEEAAALKAALAMSVQEEDDKPLPVGPGLPPNFQGQYELFAVVTHKGRDADGGHYMAWVKASNDSGKVEKIADTDEDNEDWFVFDDDEVSPCKTEDVLKLKGGGDWHMSYINFYRAVSAT
jgi:ubiquitin carboxyl-terminal hydrolase 14